MQTEERLERAAEQCIHDLVAAAAARDWEVAEIVAGRTAMSLTVKPQPEQEGYLLLHMTWRVD